MTAACGVVLDPVDQSEEPPIYANVCQRSAWSGINITLEDFPKGSADVRWPDGHRPVSVRVPLRQCLVSAL